MTVLGMYLRMPFVPLALKHKIICSFWESIENDMCFDPESLVIEVVYLAIFITLFELAACLVSHRLCKKYIQI